MMEPKGITWRWAHKNKKDYDLIVVWGPSWLTVHRTAFLRLDNWVKEETGGLVRILKLKQILQRGLENGRVRVVVVVKKGQGSDTIKALNRSLLGVYAKMWATIRMKRKTNNGGQVIHTPFIPKMIKVMSWNCNGIKLKKELLVEYILENDISVGCIQETKCTEDDWLFRVPGYNVIETLAEDGPGRNGISMIVKNNIEFTKVGPQCPYILSIMTLSSKVDDEDYCKKLIFSSLYLPPNNSIYGCKGVRQLVVTILTNLRKKFKDVPIIIGGDFNMSLKQLLAWSKKNFSSEMVRVSDVSGSRKTRPSGRDIDHCICIGMEREEFLSSFIDCEVDMSDHWPLVSQFVLEKPFEQVISSRKVFKREKLKRVQDNFIHDNIWNNLLEEEEGNADKPFPDKFCSACSSSLEKFGVSVSSSQRTGGRKSEKIRLPQTIRKCIKIRNKFMRKTKKVTTSLRDHMKAHKKYVKYKDKTSLLIREFKILKWNDHISKSFNKLTKGDVKGHWRWLKTIISKGKGAVSRKLLTPLVDPDSGQVKVQRDEIELIQFRHFEKLAKDPITNDRSEENSARYYTRLIRNLKLVTIPKMADSENEEISWQEINGILSKSKNGKAPGMDGIPIEVFKLATIENSEEEVDPSFEFRECLMKSINFIWINGSVSDEMNTSIVIPIPKKGDLSSMNNYRGISLISVALKLVCCAIASRLSKIIKLCPEQAGFRNKEECICQVASLIEIVQRRRLQGLKTYSCFLDFKKAYDMVPLPLLFAKLEARGIHGRMLNFVKILYSNSSFKVGNPDSTNLAKLERGLRQGCPLSCILFDLFIDDLLDNNKIKGVMVPGVPDKRCKGLLFADDSVILAESSNQLKKGIQAASDWADKSLMVFGIEKCGIMMFNYQKSKSAMRRFKRKHFLLQGQKVPFVDNYLYLGINIKQSLNIDEIVNARIAKGERALLTARHLLCNKTIPLSSRVMVFRACVLPVFLFGAELWGTSGVLASKVQVKVNKGIRWLIGSGANSTILSIETAQLELGIKTIHAQSAARRARVMLKALDGQFKTWWGTLCNSLYKNRKTTLVSGTMRWLKRYLFNQLEFESLLAMGYEGSVKMKTNLVKRLIVERHKNREIDKCKSLKFYIDLDLIKSISIKDKYNGLPSLQLGIQQWTRMRCGVFLSGRRLSQCRVCIYEYSRSCPFCGLRNGVGDNLEHTLLICREWYALREIMFNGLNGNLKKFILESVEKRVNLGAITAYLLGSPNSLKNFNESWNAELLSESVHFYVITFLGSMWVKRLREWALVNKADRSRWGSPQDKERKLFRRIRDPG